MNALIKSGSASDHASVRPLNLSTPGPSTLAIVQPNEEEERLHARVAALDAKLQERELAITHLRSDVQRALQDGREEGRREGLAEAEDRQAERHALLQDALQKALTEFRRRAASLDRLALLVAQECLDIILGDRSARTDLLHQILEYQISKIDKSMLVSVEVSAEDFRDETALTTLQAELGAPSLVIKTGTDIASGGCLINLRLGQMDVGINQQWQAVRDLLGDMALAGELQ